MAELFPRSLTTADVNVAGYKPRRGGRAVDCAGLENRKAERPREFESHPLREIIFRLLIRALPTAPREKMGDQQSTEDPQNCCADHVGKIMRSYVHTGESDQDRDGQTGESGTPTCENQNTKK